jgi:C4-dicarboxylate-binding protein DctP
MKASLFCRTLAPTRLHCLLAAALFVAVHNCALALGPAVTIRFSHVVAEATPKGQMALRFKALVEQRSAGRLRVEVYPESGLYGDDDEMEALRLGAVEILAPSLSKFGNAGVPELEVFDLPFLFDNLDEVRKVTQGPVGLQLLRRLERQQMTGLGFLDNGFKHFSASKPLRNLGDFSQQRLRVQASQVLVAQMRALGAQPVVLPFGELQRALRAGVVQGAENTLTNFLTQELASTQSDVTLTGHGYLGYAVVANQRFWASLQPREADLIALAMRDALEFGNQLSAQLDQQALRQLRKTGGVRIHTLTATERTALRRAVQPVYASFERRAGAALLRDIQDTAETGD